jgi:hypothetical protein
LRIFDVLLHLIFVLQSKRSLPQCS